MTDISLATNVPFAVTAGVATFFSPCAYPLLPGYVGFYVNSVDADSASVLGAGARGLAAAVGVLATFALLAGATVRIGYSTLANITVFETLVGGLLIVFGLLVVFGRTPRRSRCRYRSDAPAYSDSAYSARDTHWPAPAAWRRCFSASWPGQLRSRPRPQ